jgi:hypothetical protein
MRARHGGFKAGALLSSLPKAPKRRLKLGVHLTNDLEGLSAGLRPRPLCLTLLTMNLGLFRATTNDNAV